MLDCAAVIYPGFQSAIGRRPRLIAGSGLPTANPVDACGLDRVLPYSCKRRGFCPSCGGRPMADTAAHLVDLVFPEVPVRQWVLSVPYGLRYRLAECRILFASGVIRCAEQQNAQPSAVGAAQQSPEWKSTRQRALEPWVLGQNVGLALQGRHSSCAALAGLVPNPAKPGVSPRALLLRAFSAGICFVLA
jgi:hypothetical protein